MSDSCGGGHYALGQLIITGPCSTAHTTATTTFNSHCIALKTHELQAKLDYSDFCWKWYIKDQRKPYSCKMIFC